MSNIDKQALRQTAEKAQEHGVFNMDMHSETLLALLDELEAAEKRIAEQQKTLLAARSYVKLHAAGDGHAFGLLQAIDRAAGIGKGE